MTQTSGKSPHRRGCRTGAGGGLGGEGECLISFPRADSLRGSQPRVLHPVIITGTDGGAGTGSAQLADACRCQLHFPRHRVLLFLSGCLPLLTPGTPFLELKVCRLRRAKQCRVLSSLEGQGVLGRELGVGPALCSNNNILRGTEAR